MANNFKKINWGPDEAKGDQNLLHYFMKIPDYDALMNGNKRYIIGRKGTGKTALLERIKLSSTIDKKIKTKELSLRDFPINDLRGFQVRGMQDKSKFVPIWTFLIIVELCKTIVNDDFAENYMIKNQLKSFLEENKIDLKGGFVETVRVLNSKESKVSFFATIFGGEAARGNQVEYSGPIHFTKAIEPLKEILKKISSPNSLYFILFDELDEGYKADDVNKRLLLLSLFRATENLVLEFKKYNFNFRPIIALRSDIFDNLEDNDLNKYDDYLLRLNWQSDNRMSYSLQELVNTRIRHSMELPPSDENDWNKICVDYDARSHAKKSVWRYMLNCTFERPRDIIKFLKYCSELHPGKGMLTFDHVKSAENSYSDWLYREIRDEIQSHLPVWKEAINCLTKIGKGVLTTEELLNTLERDKEIAKYVANSNIDLNDIAISLFDFSIIGNLDERDRWLFKYKDHDLVWSSSRRLTVHFGLHKKLRLKGKS
jgi:hypothetical protein